MTAPEQTVTASPSDRAQCPECARLKSQVEALQLALAAVKKAGWNR